jgi:hypothetical protein
MMPGSAHEYPEENVDISSSCALVPNVEEGIGTSWARYCCWHGYVVHSVTALRNKNVDVLRPKF